MGVAKPPASFARPAYGCSARLREFFLSLFLPQFCLPRSRNEGKAVISKELALHLRSFDGLPSTFSPISPGCAIQGDICTIAQPRPFTECLHSTTCLTN